MYLLNLKLRKILLHILFTAGKCIDSLFKKWNARLSARLYTLSEHPRNYKHVLHPSTVMGSRPSQDAHSDLLAFYQQHKEHPASGSSNNARHDEDQQHR